LRPFQDWHNEDSIRSCVYASPLQIAFGIQLMSVIPQLVSVVVPTRNSARTLEACLKSVRQQGHSRIELIVVDNHSSDNTLRIARQYCDFVEVAGPERSAQRNLGAQLAHGDYLLFIDSDMTLAPGVVGDCLDAVGAVDAPGVIIPEVSVGNGFWAHCRALERSCYVGDDAIEAARFFPRSSFDESGGFDEKLTAFEDWDLSIRIAAGRRLPRTATYITHDEGRLRLGAVLSKKRDYGGSFHSYWRKHGYSSLGQANPVFRSAFRRNWRTLLRHPGLTLGFLSLKVLEAGAGGWGLVVSRTRGELPREPNPLSH
jgi:glycosyltransferase involved in cell wall biosynthesis